MHWNILICVFRKFSSSVQENLFRGPGDLSDLVSINIQRSRERGVPSYVTYRNSGVCNLKAYINSFEDLGKVGFRKEDIENLKKLYEDVKDIDLFTGGMQLRLGEGRGGGCILRKSIWGLLRDSWSSYPISDKKYDFSYPTLRPDLWIDTLVQTRPYPETVLVSVNI